MSRPAAATADAPVLLDAPVHFLPHDTEPLTELSPDHHADHVARFGVRPSCRPQDGRDLVADLTEAELTGRGGGHFPVATKWRAVRRSARHGAGVPLVIGNGAEGEPLSRKDAALLSLRPHLVVDGLVSAAEALGADEAVLWLHADAHAVRAAVTRALNERSGRDTVPVRVAIGPDHYLTGESSSVVNGVAGRPALPMLARVPAAAAGVDGRPTLVQNAETMARVALIARGFPARGVMVTVAGPRHLVAAHVPDNATIASVVARYGGNTTTVPQAVLVGGYGGRFVSWTDARRLRVTPRRAADVPLGAGVLAPVAAGECGLRRAAGIAEFLAASSAGQCGPCRFGLPAIAETVRALADGAARRRDVARLERWLAEVTGRGACRHPDGAVNLVASALATFADDVQVHMRRGCLHDRSGRG